MTLSSSMKAKSSLLEIENVSFDEHCISISKKISLKIIEPLREEERSFLCFLHIL